MPGLREWLAMGKWKRYFDQDSLQRSTAYASERFIKEIGARSDFMPQEVIIGALVHGNAPRPYETDLLFRKVRDAWTVDPDCSCPVAYLCKHSAGLLSFIAAQLAKTGHSGVLISTRSSATGCGKSRPPPGWRLSSHPCRR